MRIISLAQLPISIQFPLIVLRERGESQYFLVLNLLGSLLTRMSRGSRREAGPPCMLPVDLLRAREKGKFLKIFIFHREKQQA